MAFVNLAQREIQCKVVYYGSGRSGKTENLVYIYSKLHPGTRGRMISIDTKGEKTLFFDFLPLDLGEVRGLRIRMRLYTVPGQPQYAPTRKVVLAGADGVVFVADSLEVRRRKNIECFRELQRSLNELGFPLDNSSTIGDLPCGSSLKPLHR
jgi:mutual gliding-motility protein MglA